MSSSLRDTWDDVATNPDPVTDLGYLHEPLTVVNVDEGGAEYIFLPGEEAHLSDEEFIVAEGTAVVDLEDRR